MKKICVVLFLTVALFACAAAPALADPPAWLDREFAITHAGETWVFACYTTPFGPGLTYQCYLFWNDCTESALLGWVTYNRGVTSYSGSLSDLEIVYQNDRLRFYTDYLEFEAL